MNLQIWAAVPSRQGHFLLESGYHADTWLDLDGLFVDQAAVAPLVSALADRLRLHIGVEAICGPLVGGAFLAQALAHTMRLPFYFTEPTRESGSGLFKAQYRLPHHLRTRIKGAKVAVVDDVISAGSSVRATISELEEVGATAVVVGTFLLMGDTGANHFAQRGLPVEALDRRPFAMWKPDECPLCRAGLAIESP